MSAAGDFRAAVERGDLDAARATLAADVVFHSPVTFHPFRGAEKVGALLGAVFAIFEDFRYVAETESVDGGPHGLLFSARVGDRQLEGIDLITVDADGLICDFTVMLRPMSATVQFAQRAAARFEEIGLAPDKPAASA